mmetsp:Transcript_25225/g.59481  ORF Transcript_25225/g.59481 Transcript_25225/m.59481 type:complete len:354 (+) Transcript_25225:1100-2161(+)
MRAARIRQDGVDQGRRLAQKRKGGHSHDRERHSAIDQRRQQQGPHDANGHVLFGMDDLFRQARYHIKADECVKHQTGSPQNPRHAGRSKGQQVVGRFDRSAGQRRHHDEGQNAQVRDADEVVEGRTVLGSPEQDDRRDDHNDQRERRAGVAGRDGGKQNHLGAVGNDPVGPGDLDQEIPDVVRPRPRRNTGGEPVSQYQVPADAKGVDLSKGHVRVNVGRSTRGNQARELGVGEGRQRAGEAAPQKAQGDGGSRELGSDARQDVDPGTDGRSQAVENQIHRVECASEACGCRVASSVSAVESSFRQALFPMHGIEELAADHGCWLLVSAGPNVVWLACLRACVRECVLLGWAV